MKLYYFPLLIASVSAANPYDSETSEGLRALHSSGSKSHSKSGSNDKLVEKAFQGDGRGDYGILTVTTTAPVSTVSLEWKPEGECSAKVDILDTTFDPHRCFFDPKKYGSDVSLTCNIFEGEVLTLLVEEDGSYGSRELEEDVDFEGVEAESTSNCIEMRAITASDSNPDHGVYANLACGFSGKWDPKMDAELFGNTGNSIEAYIQVDWKNCDIDVES